MLTEMANAWWGARNTLTIAAEQAAAAGAVVWPETIVTVAHVVGAIVLLVYWGVVLAGLFRNPVKGKDATSQPPA